MVVADRKVRGSYLLLSLSSSKKETTFSSGAKRCLYLTARIAKLAKQWQMPLGRVPVVVVVVQVPGT